MAGETPNPLTLDSTDLFQTALTTFFSHHQPPPHLLPPIPSTFPHSKLIPNTRFAVDAFRHAGAFSISYFLSHFHSDHYTGLSPNWSQGLVFCSPTTARLLTHVLRVPSPFVVPLPLRQPLLIDGCHVLLLDANHCPGAVQFLFKLPNSQTFIHTGDFRFSHSMPSDPLLAPFVNCDAVFLDTTYCNPKFVFPSQQESVDYICSVIETVGGGKGVLFLVATYVIGKEKILLEIARRCKRKVHVDGRKMEVLRVLGVGDSGGVFTEEQCDSDVHVVGWNVLGETWPYFRPNFVRMEEIMAERGYSRVVGFVPTGWTYEVKRNKFAVRSKDELEIHLVPYSEHSNYDELREYVRFLKPKRVIPTVGSDVEKIDSKHASKMQKHFAGLVDEMANKKEFLRGFRSGCTEVGGEVGTDAKDHTTEGEYLEERATCSAVDTNVGSPTEVLSTLQEPESQAPVLLTEEKEEEIVQELRDCLPSWVTRQQMLELIRGSGGDIVEAVTTFYDRETEFRGQGTASTSAVSTSETSTLCGTASPTKAGSVYANIDVSSIRDHFMPNPRNIVKSGISPGKRGKKTSNRVNKKVKLQSKLDSCGPKQSTITNFFRKVLPNVAESREIGSTGEQEPKDTKFPDHGTQSYEDAVDQFLQIIGGNESLKSYADTIIKKANGDISMAVEIHYSDNEGRSGENEMEMVADAKSIQSNSGADNCSSKEKKVELRKIALLADSSVQLSSPDNVGANSVSLPLEKYNPVEHACWSNGHNAPYLHLARTFDLLEDEKGKMKATSMLCNMFRSLLALSPDDVLPSVYLCTNKIAADHKNAELNIGGSLVTAALEDACGTSRSKIRDMYNELGDLGDVAQACRQTQTLLAPPPPLLIKDVFSALWKISVQTGSGSSARKRSLIVNLMRSCREKEMKFLVRTLVRNLRIGAMMKTVLPALAQAVVLNSFHSCNDKGTIESLKDKLQDLVVPSLMKRGIGFSSSTLSMVPGTPIKPMLARITNGVQQALKLFQNKAFTCEYKYDGQRAQIHKLVDGSVHVFSRNGDESTSRFPDLINIINQSCKADAVTFILDAEVVGVDRKNGSKLMSFQELSSRGRGSRDASITLDSIKVDICVFVFDIMFANGQQLLSFPLRRRRKYMKEMFQDEKSGFFEYAKEMTVEADDACSTNEATLTKINSFLEDAFASSCEGVMVKCLDVDAGYSPSKRTDTWLKVKRDYMQGLGDTLDLVPIGAWHGNGRKAGWYSPFLMACYNPETEEFQSVCRVMSGFSDLFYTEMKSFYSGDKILGKKPPYYRTAEVPDVWFSAELVWEIRGADFTVSPVHQAALGLVHPSRGISIRFPRYIRTVIDRKSDECSTASDIAEMFHSQTRKMDVVSEDGS
ncbi:DNA ligase 6 isoform X2 [Argentina anserina]|uniref:DNA ligase 6 isoform X2 n=1 Tax=Argentina anserina TaxID=57926 RepID=UPI0021763128|nr:DNA ligase 6 isoform X2 [Potentilla anserina]